MLTPKQQAIIAYAQEKLAELIEERVKELAEDREELDWAEEDYIEECVERIFNTWKEEIAEAAETEFKAAEDSIEGTIWGGFIHKQFCIDTAKEKARELL